jgi:elongator complex protein 3
VKSSQLYQYWKKGKYHPFSTEQLINLIADIKPSIPPYCRVNRIIRDIPADYIVAGNKRSSLRQDVLAELIQRGQHCQCIRCREIRGQFIDPSQLKQEDFSYHAADAVEHFLSFVTPENRLAGYLRLSIPELAVDNERSQARNCLLAMAPELQRSAIIREVHIYGQSLDVGIKQDGTAQHIGLGTSLLKRAEEITQQYGLKTLVVIAAIGTREYYRSRGYEISNLYMKKDMQD